MADIDWKKLFTDWGPAVLQLLGSAYGAQNQNSTNEANLDAINARNTLLQGYINPLFQRNQNPYSAALMSFIGRPGLGAAEAQYNPFSPYGGGQSVGTSDKNGVLVGYTTTGQPIYAPKRTTPTTQQTQQQSSTNPVFEPAPTTPTGPQPSGNSALPNQYVFSGADRRDPNDSQARANEAASLRAQGYWDDEIQIIQQQNDAYNAGTRGSPADKMAAGSRHGGQLYQGPSAGQQQASSATQASSPDSFVLGPQQPAQPAAAPAPQPNYGHWEFDENGQGMFVNDAPPQGSMPGLEQNTAPQVNASATAPPPLVTPQQTGGPTYTGFPDPMDPHPVPTTRNPPQFDPTSPPAPPNTPTDPNYPPQPQIDPNNPSAGPQWPTAPSSDTTGMGQMYRYNDPGENAFTYTPPVLRMSDAPTVTGVQGFNAGQDSLMQMMRRGGQVYGSDPTSMLSMQQGGEPNAVFNNSDIFKALEPLDQRLIDRNVSQLRAGAGSLGARFGTAMAQNEARLREQLGQDVLARNAQLASSSYENAQNRSLQSALGLTTSLGQTDALNQQAKLANQGVQAQFGLHGTDILNQAGQFNAGQRMTQNQFTAGQGQQYNSNIVNALAGANSMQQGQNSQNANLISLLAGLPVGQSQPSAWPGFMQDTGQMLMLLPFLRSLMGGSGSSSQVPTGTPQYNNYWQNA